MLRFRRCEVRVALMPDDLFDWRGSFGCGLCSSGRTHESLEPHRIVNYIIYKTV